MWEIRNRGFTLVETLVTITIFAIISVGLASSFFSGIRLWDRARAVSGSYSEVLLTLEEIAMTLRQSVNVSAIQFEGDAQKVAFPSLEEDTIAKIIYEFRPEEGTLIRKEIPMEKVLAGKEEENIIERQLMKIETLQLKYLSFDKEQNRYQWQKTWNPEQGIFTAIQWTIKSKDEEFTKTIFLPIAD